MNPYWVDRADRRKEVRLKAALFASQKADTSLLDACNVRWDKLTQNALTFSLQTNWRVIAGLGKKSSLEVGFTFHRYGFPYLPGISLKGLARTYGLLEVAVGIGEDTLKEVGKNSPLATLDKTLSRDEEKKFNDEMQVYGVKEGMPLWGKAKAFRNIFGTTERAGKAAFFDAIPSAAPKLELDIMNPHYPDYYKEAGSDNPKEYPTNWQSPNPVKFLAVASGKVFRFAIGWRGSPEDAKPDSEKKQTKFSWWKGAQIEKIKNPAPEDHPGTLKLARRWLQGGLLDLGAGGKTSAGYGYFIE
jgi:CRISPR-associated protein Cmr6